MSIQQVNYFDVKHEWLPARQETHLQVCWHQIFTWHIRSKLGTLFSRRENVPCSGPLCWPLPYSKGIVAASVLHVEPEMPTRRSTMIPFVGSCPPKRS